MTEMINLGGAHPPENYGDRVVGFVDILGFADLVRRADRMPSLRADIVNALNTVRSIASPERTETDLRTQNFSDSLILSANNTADGFWHLLLSIDALAWNLLQIGVVIRGGVTIGGMQHDDQIVFGVGVNEAYRLESAIAKVPRVVLGSRAMAAARHHASEHPIWATYSNARLLRDHDGVWFLNWLTELAIFNCQDPSNAGMRRHPMHAMGQAVRTMLQSKVDETLDLPDVYAKVDWLARYWNGEVAAPRSDGQQPVLGPIRLAGQEPRTTPLPFRTY